eukprot:gene4936-6904_t
MQQIQSNVIVSNLESERKSKLAHLKREQTKKDHRNIEFSDLSTRIEANDKFWESITSQLKAKELDYKTNIEDGKTPRSGNRTSAKIRKSATVLDFMSTTKDSKFSEQFSNTPHWYLIHPSHKWKKTWDLIVSFIVLYSVIVIPYRLVFKTSNNISSFNLLDLIIFIMFMVDIVLTFNTAIRNPKNNRLIVDHSSIACQYLTFWFWIDLLSTIPFELILPSSFGSSQSFRLVRGLRLFRLTKLLGGNQLKESLSGISIDPLLVNLLVLIFEIFYIIHLFACIWYYLGSNASSTTSNWIKAFNDDGNISSNLDLYVASLYWTTATMLTIGYGDIVARNVNERLFAIITMLTGGILFGALINKVTRLIQNRNPQSVAMRTKMNALKQFMAEQKYLSFGLVRKIKDAYSYYLYKKSSFNEDLVYEDLPKNIRQTLVLDLYRNEIQKIELFKSLIDKNHGFVSMLLMRMKPFYVQYNSTIYQQGDVCSELIFITNGCVRIENKNGLVVGFVNEGSYFGDFEYIKNTLCLVTYIAARNCDLLSIPYQYMKEAESEDFHASIKFQTEMKDRYKSFEPFLNNQIINDEMKDNIELYRKKSFLDYNSFISSTSTVSTPHSITNLPNNDDNNNSSKMDTNNISYKFNKSIRRISLILPSESEIIECETTKCSNPNNDDNSNINNNNNNNGKPDTVSSLKSKIKILPNNLKGILWIDGKIVSINTIDPTLFSDSIDDENNRINDNNNNQNSNNDVNYDNDIINKLFKSFYKFTHQSYDSNQSVLRKRRRKKLSYRSLVYNRTIHKPVIVDQFDDEDLFNAWLVNPQGSYKVKWDLLIGLLIIYVVATTPIEIAFNADLIHSRPFGLLIDTMFLLDIILAFRTPYINEEDGILITITSQISWKYFKSWFFIDLISSFPFELVNNNAGKASKLLKSVRILRLLKLSKAFKISTYIDMLEDYINISSSIFGLFKIIIGVFFIAHILCCTWFGLSSIMTKNTWYDNNSGTNPILLTENNNYSIANAPLKTRYLVSLYWTFTTISTVGYGDIVSVNSSERLLNIIIIIIGATVFAYVISNVSTIIDNLNQSTIDTSEKISNVIGYLSDKKCSSDLSNTVLSYCIHKYKTILDPNQTEIISSLPNNLKIRLILALNRKIIKFIPLFNYIENKSIIEYLFSKMDPLFVLANDYITREDSDPNEVIFIISGHATKLTNKNKKKRRSFIMKHNNNDNHNNHEYNNNNNNDNHDQLSSINEEIKLDIEELDGNSRSLSSNVDNHNYSQKSFRNLQLPPYVGSLSSSLRNDDFDNQGLIVLEELFPSSFYGYNELMNSHMTFDYSVRARETCDLYVLERASIMHILTSHPMVEEFSPIDQKSFESIDLKSGDIARLI